MTEVGQIKNMFVEKQQGETYKAEIYKIHKDRQVRTGAWNACKIGYVQKNSPGRNNQTQHNNIFPRKFKIIGIYQIGKKVCQKVRENSNQYIQ